jgi:kynurenine formamidase
MQIIDLTHMVEAGMPQYPGSKDASFGKVARIEQDGYNETFLQFSCHTGTHIDCGRHLFLDGFDTGNSSPDRFYGKGLIINCCQPAHSMVIEKDRLSSYGPLLRETDFVLFYTGWDRYWGKKQYFSGYPVMDEAAARYLVTFSLKGVGIDALSFDLPDSHD